MKTNFHGVVDKSQIISIWHRFWLVGSIAACKLEAIFTFFVEVDFRDGLLLATPILKQLEISFPFWREYSSQRFFAAQVYWFDNGSVSTT